MQTFISTQKQRISTAQQVIPSCAVLRVREGVMAAYWYLASFYFGYFNQMPNRQ